MNRWGWRRVTGILGITWFVLQLVGVVLFVSAGSPPNFDDAKRFADYVSSASGLFVADAFLTSVAWTVLLLQFTGIRSVIREAGEDWEWAAALFFAAGLLLIAIGLVGAAIEATAALISKSGASPTTVDSVWLGSAVLFTSIYFPSAIALGTASYAVLKTGVLPRWIGWLGGVCAALNVGGALTMLGGTGNYGPNGLLPLILGFTPAAVWVLAVSVTLLGVTTGGRPTAVPLTQR